LSASALYYALVAPGAREAHAAVIEVEGACTLPDAIAAANFDLPTGGCNAGDGADTLVLQQNSVITLSTIDNEFQGGTGLPVITSPITIVGNRSRIVRDPDAEPFRLMAVEDADVTLQDLELSGGYTEEQGGAIFVNDGLGSTRVVIERSTLFNNHAGDEGGAIHIDFSDVVLQDVTITDNGATNGGGMSVILSDLTAERTAILNNVATTGGGIYGALCDVTISNSTFSHNEAEDDGGALAVDIALGLSIVHSTITGNVANEGGGLFLDESSAGSLTHNIVSGNQAESAREIVGPPVDSQFNLIGHSGDPGTVGFVFDVTDIVPVQSLGAIVELTPRRNGGPTTTHMLPAGSPAIDAAPIEDCPAIDQRGVSRPRGEACDIGAVERVLDPCSTAVPTTGCTINGVPGRLCRGTAANDVIIGTAQDDVIIAAGGDDTVQAGDGADLVCGGAGHDELIGEAGDDELFGGPGIDVLTGGAGADSLSGGQGIDSCQPEPVDVNVMGCDE